jgi:hypothetical protein
VRDPACQEAGVLHPAPRIGEQGFEQQVKEQVVAPHIDEVGDRRANPRDVGKILVGPTPMYAPPLTPADVSAGMTSR